MRQPDNDKWTFLTTHLSKLYENLKVANEWMMYLSIPVRNLTTNDPNSRWHTCRLQDAGQVLERQAYGIRKTHGAIFTTDNWYARADRHLAISWSWHVYDIPKPCKAPVFSSLWARESEVNNVCWKFPHHFNSDTRPVNYKHSMSNFYCLLEVM